MCSLMVKGVGFVAVLGLLSHCKCRVEAFETGGVIDCEKSVRENRESQRECDTLSQLHTPRQLVVLAQPP